MPDLYNEITKSSKVEDFRKVVFNSINNFFLFNLFKLK